MMKDSYYKNYLRAEFSRRQQDNSRYSLRAFSKTLGVDPGGLSRNLNGRGRYSLSHAKKIADRLMLPASTRRQFLKSVVDEHHPDIAEDEMVSLEKIEIDPEVFSVISEWYHYAILELTYLPNFKSSPTWISQQLGISILTARLAIARLKSLGLLCVRAGKLVKTSSRLSIKDKSSTSAAQKRYQDQILQKASLSLHRDALDRRNHSSTTIPISRSKLPHAKEMIAAFSQELTRYLCDGEKLDEVYQLSICLFPLKE